MTSNIGMCQLVTKIINSTHYKNIGDKIPPGRTNIAYNKNWSSVDEKKGGYFLL